MDLSAIIITKDEEENVKECVGALSFADEIIVIDNCSKDKTVEIAKKCGAVVYTHDGLDFAKIRNFGKEKAQGRWILYVDADERVTKKLATEIMEAVKSDDFQAYKLTRQNYFFHKLWPKTEEIVRLVKKDSLLKWQGSLHETAVVKGEIGSLSNPLLHYTHDDVTKMVDKTNQWSDIEARLRFENHHPQMKEWRFFRVMFTFFWKSYITDGGWKVGTTGLVESMYQSFSACVTYAKLWELQNSKKI